MKKFTFLMLFAVMAIAANAVTVYYDNTNTKWDKVNAYAWDGTNLGNLNSWPGAEMTAVDGQAGWFQIDVKDAKYVIFNNGSGKQTADLNVNAAKPYYKDGGWADSFSGEVVVVKNKIYFKNNNGWSKVNAYTWNGITTGSWPGTAMTPVAGQDGWYEIEVVGEIDGASIIFNDGSAQTDNLTIDGTKPYYNNGWTDGFGGAVVPADSKYFLKHPFDGGNWEWKEMTKQADGTYTLVANWNGVGANVHTQQNDEGAQWNPAEQITGAPNATGVEVTYIYDPATSSLSIKYEGIDVEITYYITGNANFHKAIGIEGEWNPALKELDGEISFTAIADSVYQFKVTNGSWDVTYGHGAVDTQCSNVTSLGLENDANIEFKLDVDATVTVTFNEETKTICINKVDLPSALEEVVAGRVFAENGTVRAILDEAALVEVFALNGTRIDSQVSADYKVALGQGMYIVRINGKAHKVVLY